MFGQGASLIVHKALRINEPDAFASVVLRETLELEETQQLLGHSNASGSSSEEENPLLLERQIRGCSRKFCRVNEPG